MLSLIKPFIILGIIVLSIDIIYLTSVKNLFNKLLRGIQGSDIVLNMPATILDYLLIVFSIFYFIILKNGSIEDAALLGFCIYGIYELTNMAVIKKWNWKVVVLDTIWGSILYSVSVALFRLIN